MYDRDDYGPLDNDDGPTSSYSEPTSWGDKLRSFGTFLKRGLIIASIPISCQQLTCHNTSYDKLTVKYVWCDKQELPSGYQPKRIDVGRDVKMSSSYALDERVDGLFVDSNAGDTLSFGELDLIVKESRPQELTKIPNENDDLTDDAYRMKMGCPGYINVDVYFKGELIPGGEDVDMAYAAKFRGRPGALLDGVPNFSLKEILEMTDLDDETMKEYLGDIKLHMDVAI